MKPPGYGDSVPVQECLKEPRWSAYGEGRWGNRTNPPAPAGDVSPEATADVPVGERLVAPTAPILLGEESSSDSGSESHPSSSSLESSPGPRQRIRRLTRRMHYSEPEEVSGSTTGQAVNSPATTFPAFCGPSNTAVAEEASTMPAPQSQAEAEETAAAGASPVIVRTSRARNRLSQAHQEETLPRMSPQGARSKTPEDQSPVSRPVTPVTPLEPQLGWRPIDTDSWETYEDVARRATQGIVRRTINYATDELDLLRTDVDTQVEWRVEALKEARHSKELQQIGDMDELMGRTRGLWRCKEDCKAKITTLEAQNQELERQRAQGADEQSKLRNQIRELTEDRTELLQKLEAARAQPPPAASNSPEVAFIGPGDADARIRQMQQECERLDQEREVLQQQVAELQAVNAELNVDLEQAGLAIDICLPCVTATPGAPVTLDKPMLALVTSMGKRSVRHPQLSAPSPLILPRGPFPSALDTPTSQLTPTLTTPVGRPPSGPPPRTLVPFPRPTQPASASLAAPTSQESDWEAEMTPVPPDPESQQ